MITEPVLELNLRTLHLSSVLANYRRLLTEHAEPLPYLSDLISLEATKRHENGVRARIVAARFPTMKTIESFDFKLQPEPRSTAWVWIAPKQGSVSRYRPTLSRRNGSILFRCGNVQRRNPIPREPPIGSWTR